MPLPVLVADGRNPGEDDIYMPLGLDERMKGKILQVLASIDDRKVSGLRVGGRRLRVEIEGVCVIGNIFHLSVILAKDIRKDFFVSYDKKVRDAIILNGYNVATIYSTWDPDRSTCVGCAVLSRSWSAHILRCLQSVTSAPNGTDGMGRRTVPHRLHMKQSFRLQK
ncbi:hypothetical protein Asppvi_005524 [Aspergillus pseudoviridinutans]|uniref:Uncharacterized protein n=1 Tax=Aspergillus pseudoviridinutans TaxID=1517512 RepID=A0A9P3EUG5_9EURO|nr:uncharacterized protein Asppvi_005524 [Aspergillus pseudoviridinutans]GIJ86632.1 hypothetical protein Asppvi_005524 [Aspergillus pseudoviridinutans]